MHAQRLCSAAGADLFQHDGRHHKIRPARILDIRVTEDLRIGRGANRGGARIHGQLTAIGEGQTAVVGIVVAGDADGIDRKTATICQGISQLER